MYSRRNLLVTQKWAPVPPNPSSSSPSYLRIYISSTLDVVQESDGWIFVRDGAAMAAIKIVSGGYTWTSPWQHGDTQKNKCFVQSDLEDSPVILIANHSADYDDDFNAFKTAVKAQPIRFIDGVLHFATIEFHGSKQASKIKGKPVNLAPALVYDSPFIRSNWASGLIYIRKGNSTEILDFRDSKNPRKAIDVPVTSDFPSGIGSDQPIVFRKP
ncbi:MAG: hypothetical protein SGI77_19645 [Pirellulaceae bacterium]|nr:hypothetical protein [Pirellulaceae bacterium]